MKPERWREVERIFYAALECAPDQRAEFVAKECAGDPELIGEVESLLACNEEADHIGLLAFTEDAVNTKTFPIKKNPATIRDEPDSAWIPDPTTELVVRRYDTNRLRTEILNRTPSRLMKPLLTISILTAIVFGAVWFGTKRNSIDRGEDPKTRNIGTARFDMQNTRFVPPADIKFEKLTSDQGLSVNTVYCMMQDSQGFMWFGTIDGLNRYDGYEFTVFKHNLKDANSLSNNYITALFEDSSGIIWVGTATGGLNRYDPATQTFVKYRSNEKNPNSLGSDHIIALCGDGENALWIGTSEGLFRLDVKTGLFSSYLHDEKNPASLSNNFTTALLKGRDGALWVGTADQGLNRLDVKTGLFSSYRHDEKNPASLSNDHVITIFQDREGAMWVGTYDASLNRYDPQTGSFIHYSYKSGVSAESERESVRTIFQDRSGLLWLGTFAGLYRFDPVSRTSFLYSSEGNDPNSIGDNRINSICEDRAGALWIGTIDAGVRKYDPIGNKFAPVRLASIYEKGNGGNNVSAISKDQKGRIWVGTADSGLYRYNPADQSVVVYRPDASDPNSLNDDTVRTLWADDGKLWIGSRRGLNLYDLEKDRFIPRNRHPAQLSIIENTSINAFFEDRSQNLWIGTLSRGLGRYDKKNQTFTIYRKDDDPPSGLSSDRIGCIYQDRSGYVWIGTIGGGLNRYDPASRSFTVYKTDSGDPTSIAGDRVNSICEDREGGLWLGTAEGLSRYDSATNSFASFRKSDGLPNDFIYGVLEDLEGRLWLSTNGGLSRLDPKTKSFNNYDVADGLQSNEFNLGSYFKSGDGELFFGGINGFNAFYPERIKENAYPPLVSITNFTALDKTGKQAFSINKPPHEPIKFPYNHNFFQFEFVALNYTHPEKNRYAYKLEGVDGDWINSGAKRYARYADLAPGEYTFKVRGSNNDGIWSYEDAKIGFVVAPPLWKTWWAYLFYIASLTISIYSIHRYRLHLLEERNRILEARVIERTAEVNKKKEELEKKNKALLVKNSELVESHKRADRIFSALAEALPGTILDGKYRLEEKIGSGGFGTVYRGEHLAMKRAVAVKVFKPVPGNDSAEALERFMLEAVSACRVNHKNAVAVLDSGISIDGIAYLVMELLDGRTLTSELRESKVLSAERCAQILLPVCSALAKAHSMGIVHRDVKPDNIFLHNSPDGELVKVVDFGIAKLLENGADAQFANLTFTGGLIGTPLYISPERLAMNPYDGRADVYSLGVVLYEMLCGRTPFSPEDGGGFPAVIAAQMTKDPPSLRERNPLVTKKMEKVVMKALEKDPAKRLTAMELAEEFAKAVESQAASI